MSLDIRDRIAPMTWDLMLTTLYSLHAGPPIEEEDDLEVFLISPWISDIEHRQHRLSLPIREVVEEEVGRNLRNLSDLLGALSAAGANVRVMTAPQDSDWKRNLNPEYKNRETVLLNSLAARGVDIRMHATSHAKWVSTPVGHLRGSANITDNGFYNNTEAMTLTLRQESGYRQGRVVCSDIWYEGYPFVR